ncbi:MAG: sigma-70 family RNA polymerase sigma factor [Bacteroidota bacterium]
MTTEVIWNTHASSLYFFILKRVGNTATAQDVLQNTFLKTHEHLDSLKNPDKVRPWVFRIARNELADHFKRMEGTVPLEKLEHPEESDAGDNQFCCFERFLEELPNPYRSVMQRVYLEGKTNADAANELNISLANVKARIRRAKDMMKKRFQECCLYESHESGKLTGESDCAVCDMSGVP